MEKITIGTATGVLGGRYISAKLANMRKAQEFTVMPTDGGDIIVQSDKSIGRFNYRTREGILNTKGAYFPHLSTVLGAKAYTFPAEFVAACLEVCPAIDAETQTPLGTIAHTVRTIGKEL